MKTKYVRNAIICSLLFGMVLLSCSKKSSGSSDNTSSASGNWMTTVWGGANDTAKISISGSTGTLTYLSSGALSTRFSVNDVILTNIASSGNGTYTADAIYRYTATSGANSTVGHTTAVLTLQNSNTVFFAHYAKDASTGLTPPDYYWTKQ